MKRYHLKRKPLIILTIILTIISINLINLTKEFIASNIKENKKVAEQCDIAKNHTCSSYEINLFAKTNR